MRQTAKRAVFRLLPAVALLFCAGHSRASDVLLIGDLRLKPVADIVAGIRQTLSAPLRAYTVGEIKGRLDGVASNEGARAVIALGREAIAEALALPASVAVVYGLTIEPLNEVRTNTTGTYMATPANEYVSLVRRHLPSIKRISAVGSPSLLKATGAEGLSAVASRSTSNTFDLVRTIRQIDGADALLLLPDVGALTPTALEQIYLHSFRNNIPLLGISEKHVKEGALLALVFDPTAVGRQMGEMASQALKGVNLGQLAPSPARSFDLFLNTDTARKMGISLPEELLRKARRVYP